MTLFTAQTLPAGAEVWTAKKFEANGTAITPSMWPEGPILLEAEELWGTAKEIHILQARELENPYSWSGLHAYRDAIFYSREPDPNSPGVLYQKLVLPAYGTLREVIPVTLPFLAVWADLDAGELRVRSVGSFERGPARLQLEQANIMENW